MAALFGVVEKCKSSQTKPVPSSASESFPFQETFQHSGAFPVQNEGNIAFAVANGRATDDGSLRQQDGRVGTRIEMANLTKCTITIEECKLLNLSIHFEFDRCTNSSVNVSYK